MIINIIHIQDILLGNCLCKLRCKFNSQIHDSLRVLLLTHLCLCDVTRNPISTNECSLEEFQSSLKASIFSFLKYVVFGFRFVAASVNIHCKSNFSITGWNFNNNRCRTRIHNKHTVTCQMHFFRKDHKSQKYTNINLKCREIHFTSAGSSEKTSRF